jgi:hypothetical protein
MKVTHRSGLAIMLSLAVVIALGGEPAGDVRAASDAVRVVAEPSRDAQPTPSLEPTPTPIATSTATASPDPTPNADPTPEPTPSDDVGVLFDVVFTATMDLDQAEGRAGGEAVTWTAQVVGAQILDEPVQTWWLGMWELDVPAPGGSVSVTVSASPASQYRVTDAHCLDSTSMSLIPSTHRGQSVEFGFDAVPDGRSSYECYFTFDPTLLPSQTSDPTRPVLPPTDVAVDAKVDEPDASSEIVFAVLVGILASVLISIGLSRRRAD